MGMVSPICSRPGAHPRRHLLGHFVAFGVGAVRVVAPGLDHEVRGTVGVASGRASIIQTRAIHRAPTVTNVMIARLVFVFIKSPHAKSLPTCRNDNNIAFYARARMLPIREPPSSSCLVCRISRLRTP